MKKKKQKSKRSVPVKAKVKSRAARIARAAREDRRVTRPKVPTTGQHGNHRGLPLESLSSIEQQLAAALVTEGRPMNSGELGKAVGLDVVGDPTAAKLIVRNALRRLVREKHVTRKDFGLYVAAMEKRKKPSVSPVATSVATPVEAPLSAPVEAPMKAQLAVLTFEEIDELAGSHAQLVRALLKHGPSNIRVAETISSSIGFAQRRIDKIGREHVRRAFERGVTAKDVQEWTARLSS